MKQLRRTHQREIILEELCAHPVHPTADELYERVRRRLPRVSLATVYRNLEILSDLGIIQKIEAAGRQKRYDGNPEPHHHIRCVRCGRVDDVDLPESARVEVTMPERSRNGFKIMDYKLDFSGLCPQCQAMEEKETVH